MEHQLVNVEIINELIKKSPGGIALSKFDSINTCVDYNTIASMLLELKRFYKTDARNTLRININKILAHSNIDFTMYQNKGTLINMIFHADEYLYMDVETLETILKYHKWNPDNIIEKNSVAYFVKKNSHYQRHPQYAEMISTFIKYGANIELHLSGLSCGQQLYFTVENDDAFQIIMSHTTNFYDLKGLFGYARERTYGDVHTTKIFEHILIYGKISSLQYLDEKEYKNIRTFEEWLRNIRKFPLSIDLMRIAFIDPIKSFNLIDKDQHVNNAVRHLCVFRQNLECLTKSEITIPAYKYYHVAIIILFLINNPKLIVLSRDILRRIASFVFNY
uniref:Uncharacterized protein n=1 Tax=viral metagenome TaxID=1070528 RepID=A0A6C0C8R4_9ZZZZ